MYMRGRYSVSGAGERMFREGKPLPYNDWGVSVAVEDGVGAGMNDE